MSGPASRAMSIEAGNPNPNRNHNHNPIMITIRITGEGFMGQSEEVWFHRSRCSSDFQNLGFYLYRLSADQILEVGAEMDLRQKEIRAAFQYQHPELSINTKLLEPIPSNFAVVVHHVDLKFLVGEYPANSAVIEIAELFHHQSCAFQRISG